MCAHENTVKVQILSFTVVLQEFHYQYSHVDCVYMVRTSAGI